VRAPVFASLALVALSIPAFAHAQTEPQVLPTFEVTPAHARIATSQVVEAPTRQTSVGNRIGVVATGSGLFSVAYTAGVFGALGFALGRGSGWGALAGVFPVAGPLLSVGIVATQPCYIYSCDMSVWWGLAALDTIAQLAGVTLMLYGSVGRGRLSGARRETAWLVLPGAGATPLGLSLTLATY
jgi:hypothetical protein